MQATNKTQRLFSILNYLGCFFLLILVIFLSLQNRALKKQLSEMVSQSQPKTLMDGELVPPFRAFTLDEHPFEIVFNKSANKYLLFVLSTSCQFCEKNLEKWNSIVQNHYQNYLAYGISLQDIASTREYVLKNKLDFEVLVADTNFSRSYKVSSVPQSIMIDADGRVIKIWSGELRDEQVREITKLTSLQTALTN